MIPFCQWLGSSDISLKLSIDYYSGAFYQTIYLGTWLSINLQYQFVIYKKQYKFYLRTST